MATPESKPDLLLCINVGNTNTAFAAMRGSVLVARAVVATANVLERGVGAGLADLVPRIGQSSPLFVGAALASVVPAATETLRVGLDQRAISLLIVVGMHSPGMVVGVDEPDRVGPDRVANALGLLATCGYPAIAVDAGTATTLDVVDGTGTFVGGSIAAGAGTSLRSLHDYTARLPLLSLGEGGPARPAAIGRDTHSAMLAGALLGHAGLIDRLVEQTRSELGGTAICIATGGLASLLAPHCRTISRVDPDLSFRGLAYAWGCARVC